MKKQYNIPIAWESYKTYSVEAESLQEAVTIALQTFLKEPDENYLEDSFNIDEMVYEDYQDENFDINVAIQNL